MSYYLIIFLLLNNFRVHSSQGPDIYQHYDGVTLRNCGLRQKPLQLSEKCFKWHSTEDRQQISPVGNGREAYKDEFPWTAFLYYSGLFSGGECTATLLNAKWMITAAHCVQNSDKTHYVYFGSYKERGWKTVDRIFAHPDYESDKYLKDIALLKLKETVHLDYTADVYTINGICLPNKDYIYFATDLAVLTGWGRTGEGGDKSATLRTGLVKTVYNREFSLFYSCSYLWDDYASAHFGDSGGPLFQYSNGRAVFIGVTRGYENLDDCPNASHNKYNANSYTRVSIHINWINTTIFNN